jgi:acyl-CoA reductase-like NAD-dependent aldehyde dehydrogenase
MAEPAEPRARVEQLLAAARLLANPASDAGRGLRARLRETTGLSEAGIERGLSHALETQPSQSELDALLRSTPRAPRAHVLLSSNVFVAALRAIAIGLAAAPEVMVRPSRREPALAEALHALAPRLFNLTDVLSPEAGERLWAYGSDETLGEVRRSLARGVWFHAHGSGFGAAVVEADAWTPDAARRLALDTALFDQQGCLSPRLVVVRGSAAGARAVAQSLATALQTLELELPRGARDAQALAEERRCRDAAAYAFELFEAGSGWVSCGSSLVLPPSQRALHVAATSDPRSALLPFARHLTCIAVESPSLREQLSAFGGARLVALGQMQTPPLDGPVDRRHGAQGELIA